MPPENCGDAGTHLQDRTEKRPPWDGTIEFLDSGEVMALMALRLPDELREEVLAEYPTDPVEQYGRVMAEYVAIPDELLGDTAKLQTWFDRSYEWIGTLKPKSTKG